MPSSLQSFDAFWQHPVVEHLSKQLHSQIAQWPATTPLIVGCSGGRDSLLLVYLLAHLAPTQLTVVTVNHGLHADAAAWCHQVQSLCLLWGVRCCIKKVTVAAGNVEQQARTARFAAFEEVIASLPHTSLPVLILGHHAQDQAETVLLRLFSGSGVAGLSAMKPLDTRASHLQWRPLLNTPRDHITQLATLLALPYIDDPANAQVNYDRVYLRQHIWPLLTHHFKGFEPAINRSALLQQDAQHILREVARQDLQHVSEAAELRIDKLYTLSIPRQRQVLALWLQAEETYAPSFAVVESLRLNMVAAAVDADPKVVWGRWQIRRYKDRLYRLPATLIAAKKEMHTLQLGDILGLPSGQWQVTESTTGFDRALLHKPFRFEPRQGGESIHVAGRIGHWPLKKQLQTMGLANWQKSQIHMLYQADNCLGVLTAQGFIALHGTQTEEQGWTLVRQNTVT